MLCRTLLAPVVRGAENVPDGAVKKRGCLFVGNHTQFGLYDLPFLMYELYLRGHKVLLLPTCSSPYGSPAWRVTATGKRAALARSRLKPGSAQDCVSCSEMKGKVSS